jgi:hypothetical protein
MFLASFVREPGYKGSRPCQPVVVKGAGNNSTSIQQNVPIKINFK